MPRSSSARSLSTEPAAQLRTREGAVVPLQGVSARGRLEGLVFELTVEQRYRNDGSRNLEAVFTFPLPLRAVLLGFDLEIGERKLKAHAVARQEASERYEQAIDQGNTAALLEHDGNGLYTVSLGNLLAGEAAVIRYRYAELLDAHDGHVRLNVPTVIAPRYGDPRSAGLDGPAVPGADLLAEYPFDITLDLIGLHEPHAVRSPSHRRIRATPGEGGLVISLSGEAFLDRDFVVELDQAAVPTRALVARDGDQYVALASPTLWLDQAEKRPLALKILLDCSGSMSGDSMAAAKRALLAIFDRLGVDDLVSFSRFGNTVEHVTDGLEAGDDTTLQPLRTFVRGRLGADLGGTEMAGALEAVLEIETTRSRTTDLILITDGEVHDIESSLRRVARSNHRLFAIAIGAAPNEALARSLADQTGGACEFVGPTEDAEAGILRTFKRLRSTPRRLGTVQWPTQPDWTAPEPSAVFPGDTLHLFAGFHSLPAGELALSVLDRDGHSLQTVLPIAAELTENDVLPRLAAARRLTALAEDQARDLAVRYQLATQHTSFVVVAERAEGEKATDLPATIAVPHMLAAGWGGSATLDLAVDDLPNAPMPAASRRSAHILQSSHAAFEYVDLPGNRSLRESITSVRPRSEQIAFSRIEFDPSARLTTLNSLADAFAAGQWPPTTIRELHDLHGLPPEVCSAIGGLVRLSGTDESAVVAAVLAWLADTDVAQQLDPAFLSALRGPVSRDRQYRELRKSIREMLGR